MTKIKIKEGFRIPGTNVLVESGDILNVQEGKLSYDKTCDLFSGTVLYLSRYDIRGEKYTLRFHNTHKYYDGADTLEEIKKIYDEIKEEGIYLPGGSRISLFISY